MTGGHRARSSRPQSCGRAGCRIPREGRARGSAGSGARHCRGAPRYGRTRCLGGRSKEPGQGSALQWGPPASLCASPPRGTEPTRGLSQAGCLMAGEGPAPAPPLLPPSPAPRCCPGRDAETRRRDRHGEHAERCGTGRGARADRGGLPPSCPLRSRAEPRARPHFPPPWIPSWAQDAAPSAAPRWVQLSKPEGAQHHPLMGWREHKDTRVSLQLQRNQPPACLSFPSPQSSESLHPRAARRCSRFSRVSQRLHCRVTCTPRRRRALGEGVPHPPSAPPAARRPVPVRWQQGTAVSAPRQSGTLAGTAAAVPQPGDPGGRAGIQPAGAGAAPWAWGAPSSGEAFSSPQTCLSQSGSVAPRNAAGYISGRSVLDGSRVIQ